MYSKRWHGAASTIVPDSNSEVWGVVWEIDISNLPSLDNQEGVQENVYFAKKVQIKTICGHLLDCRVYQQCALPNKKVEPRLLPTERQPSLVYL